MRPIVAALILLIISVACSGPQSPQSTTSPPTQVSALAATPEPTSLPPPTLTSARTPVPNATPTPKIDQPILSTSYLSVAESSIKANPAVLDAAAKRQGNTINLVLIVHPLTSKARAQQLGENFVRMVKSLSNDTKPGKDIGTGKYDYLVGVYYPNEKRVAQGAKSRVAKRISW